VTLNLIRGVAVDRVGNVFLSEAGASRVRRVDAVTGIISTVVGGGTTLGDDIVAAAAQTFNPRGLATDAHGNLLIAEQGSHRIRAVRLAVAEPADMLAPVTTAALNHAPVNGWHNSPVTVTLNAADGASGCGVAALRYAINGGSQSVVAGESTTVHITTEGTTSLSYFAIDRAGNVEDVTVTTIRIDWTAPSIEVVAPAAGFYTVNEVASATYACSDALSGVTTCAGTVANGQILDTRAPGTHVFTVTSSDAAGNSAAKSVSYAVSYGVRLLYDSTQAKKSGSTVPITLQLADASGINMSRSDVTLAVLDVVKVSNHASTAVEDAGNANPDADFRFDPTGGGTGAYVFNLRTTGLTTGTYILRFQASGDPVVHGETLFQVR
jgi:hypothetical protein